MADIKKCDMCGLYSDNKTLPPDAPVGAGDKIASEHWVMFNTSKNHWDKNIFTIKASHPQRDLCVACFKKVVAEGRVELKDDDRY